MKAVKVVLCVFTGFLVCLARSATETDKNGEKIVKILYRLSARNLPEGKNVFAEVDKDKDASYCRTESVKSTDLDWNKICQVDFNPTDNSTRLIAETRHNRSGPDQSIGWSAFFVRDMLQNGNVLQDEIRYDGTAYGTLILTVLVACVPGEAQCGLPSQTIPLPTPIFSLKMYA